MKKTIIAATMALGMGLSAMAQSTNPLLERRYNTPYEIPPFEKITTDNYREAFLRGMEEQKKEIDAIVDNAEAPTFQNTIAEPHRRSVLRPQPFMLYTGIAEPGERTLSPALRT